MIPTPLQVVLCWHAPGDLEIGAVPPEFLEAAYRAFAGRSSQGQALVGQPEIPNWITGAELKPVECKWFRKPATIPAATLLDDALHTLVVAWVSEKLLAESPEFVRWLSEIWTVVDASDGRHALLLGVPDERLRKALLEKATAGGGSLDDCQMRTWESLGEAAVRPATVAMRALEKARTAPAKGLGQPSANLQLFISHAKIDGLSLAESLNHAIRRVSGLERFYDAHDIEAGDNWKKVLRNEAESSVMVAVRTDRYEERPWCIQEVAWADAAGAPIVVVESAISELFHPPSGLGFEGCPWVRIPDGSLTRILYAALRENLRFLLVRRGVRALAPEIASASVVLPRVPRWDSLDGALKRLPAGEDRPRYIVYPDPKLPATTCEALDHFVSARSKNAHVVNYTSLLAGPQ